MADTQSEILIYQTKGGRTRIDVRLEDDTVWLSLNQMAELFQRYKSLISRNILNVFEEGEFRPEVTVPNFEKSLLLTLYDSFRQRFLSLF